MSAIGGGEGGMESEGSSGRWAPLSGLEGCLFERDGVVRVRVRVNPG